MALPALSEVRLWPVIWIEAPPFYTSHPAPGLPEEGLRGHAGKRLRGGAPAPRKARGETAALGRFAIDVDARRVAQQRVPGDRGRSGKEIPDLGLRLLVQRACFLSLSRKCLRNLETFGSTTDMQYG